MYCVGPGTILHVSSACLFAQFLEEAAYVDGTLQLFLLETPAQIILFHQFTI